MSPRSSDRLLVRPVPARPLLAVEAVAPALPDDLAAEVDAIWEAETARRAGQLFDGHIVSLAPGTDDLRGAFIPYRRFLAQQVRPDLRDRLRVWPVGVTGLLRCPEGIVVGRRAATVILDAGRWEVGPSGSVDGTTGAGPDGIDPAANVLCELEEEIGLRRDDLADPPRAFAIAEDQDTFVVDIAYAIRTALPFRAILDRHRGIAGREYTALDVVPARERRPDEPDGLVLTDLAEALLRSFARLPASSER